MPLLKLSLLLLSVISYEVIFQWPSPPRPRDKVVVISTARERIWAWAALPCNIFLKSTLYLLIGAELLATLGVPQASLHPSLRDWLINALGSAEASPLSLSFVLGEFLVILGGYVRYTSYRALGPLFTFEQCICKDHKLVTTGPYKVVRHPGYTALLINFLGTCIVYGGPSSWLRTSGFLFLPWLILVVGIWICIVLGCVVTVAFRSTDEDLMLSERFGKEWEEWARRVPYKLVPFVY